MRLATVAALLALSAAPAFADHGQRYLPLSSGNEWTYYQTHPLARYAPWTVRVDDVLFGDVYHLSDFPGVRAPIWVAWSGNTLYAWNATTGSWATFLRFGAATGTTYWVSLGVEGFDDVRVRLRSRTARIESEHLGRTLYNCVRFAIRRPGETQEEDYWFARDIGLVKWVAPGDMGDHVGRLGAGIVGGQPFGTILSWALESGSYSGAEGPANRVVLITTQAAWEAFYAEHAPGATVPEVDFAARSVVAALAGERATGGYTVEVNRVMRDFPLDRARVRVIETTPDGIVTQATTRPFAIAVLDVKVDAVAVTWDVSAP